MGVLAVENTQAGAGGRVFPQDQLKEAAGAARERDLAVHLDGARLFNAAIATGASTASLAEPFDSLTFCLSKGLGAPIGSVVCGSADFITSARRARKQMGGGMRQIGIIAAAAQPQSLMGPSLLLSLHLTPNERNNFTHEFRNLTKLYLTLLDLT